MSGNKIFVAMLAWMYVAMFGALTFLFTPRAKHITDNGWSTSDVFVVALVVFPLLYLLWFILNVPHKDGAKP